MKTYTVEIRMTMHVADEEVAKEATDGLFAQMHQIMANAESPFISLSLNGPKFQGTGE